MVSARVGDKDVAIGPAYVVDKFLEVLDSQIDRERALKRTDLVKEVMKDRDYSHIVPYYAKVFIVSSLQNLSSDQREQLARNISEIESTIPEQCRAYALGFMILAHVGEANFATMFDDVKFAAPVVPPNEKLNEQESVLKTETVQWCILTRSREEVIQALRPVLANPATYDLGDSIPAKACLPPVELYWNSPRIDLRVRWLNLHDQPRGTATI